MEENNTKFKLDKVSPEGVRSLITLGVMLICLIGMWTVLSTFVFPNPTKTVTPADWVKKHEPLLLQVVENSVDDSVWTGIREVSEVKTVLSEIGVTDVVTDELGTHFILSTDATVLSVTCDFVLPEGFTAVQMEGASARYEKDGAYIIIDKIDDRFVRLERCGI